MSYEQSKQLLLRDFRALEGFEGVSFDMRGKKYTATEMAAEVENETEIGRHMIQVHAKTRAKTNERIKEVLANNSPKKKLWWQFWK